MTRAEIETYAAAFVAEFGTEVSTDATRVASDMGLEIREVDSEGFDGALVRIKDYNRGIVLLRRTIQEPGRKAFTIAHEFGHYVLPGHDDASGLCRRADTDGFGGLARAREIEANVFAAEILMPAAIVGGMAKQEPRFSTVEAILVKCSTSLTASAFRLSELSPHRMAVVWSERGETRWFHPSAEFRRSVRRGPLSTETLASDAFAGRTIPGGHWPVPADAWLEERNLRADSTILEESRHLPHYDAVLTLLYIKDPIEVKSDLDEDKLLEELDPEEFTLRRKRWPGKR